MKKIIIFLIVLFILSPSTYAINNAFNVEMKLTKNEIETTGNIEVDIFVSVSYSLSGFSAIVEYDKSKLELVEIVDEDKFDISGNVDYSTNSSYISGVYNKGRTGEFKIASLKFKSLDGLISGDEVTIALKDIEGSNDTVGLDNSIAISKQKDFSINKVLVDGVDIINSKSYTTTKDYVNIEVNVDGGKVTSGIGKILLEIGKTIHKIEFKTDNGEVKELEIQLIRAEQNYQNNDGNQENSEFIPKTDDNIYIQLIILILSLLSIIFYTLFIRKRSTR